MMNLLLLVLSSSLLFAQSGNEMNENYDANHNKPTNGFVIEKPKTEEEKKIDKEYVHQEFSQKMLDEACAGVADFDVDYERDKNGNIVNDKDGKPKLVKKEKKAQERMAKRDDKFNPCNQATVDDIAYVIDPMVDKMIPVLGKAYGALFGLGGSTINYNHYTKSSTVGADGKTTESFVAKKDADPKSISGQDKDGNNLTTDKKQAENKKEEKKDVCGYIPMVTEMGAEAFQHANQQNIMQQNQQQQQTNADMQAEHLYSISRMHETRKQSARMQEIGWGATSGCYVAYMISGAAMDAKLIAKTAVSAAFTIFYDRKAKNHKDWADKLKRKGDRLRELLSKKNCDPIGEKQCYCSMESTKMDAQYCLKKPKTGKNPKIANEACIGARANLDPLCECQRNNTCFDQMLVGEMGSLDLGMTAFSGPLNDVKKLTNTGLDYSTLDGSTFGNLAMTKNALMKAKAEDVGAIKLNDAQKADARLLIDAGLPPLAAALIASQPATEAGNAMIDRMRNGSSFSNSPKLAATQRPMDASLHFNNSNSRKNSYSDDDDSPRMPSKSGGGSSNADILNFAQKAERGAEIRRSPETPIFDIISYRYRSSAWKKFDVMNVPTEPAKK